MNGKIYFIGGYPGGWITSDSVQVYDTKTDTWELGAPLPIPLHHTMAAVASGKLYVIGGEAGNRRRDSPSSRPAPIRRTEAAGAWVPRAPMPTARSGGGADVIDGKIYVAGLCRLGLRGLTTQADAWTVLPSIPTQRNHLGVVALHGKLYVAGGRFVGVLQ